MGEGKGLKAGVGVGRGGDEGKVRCGVKYEAG